MYILASRSRRLYTGVTGNLLRRVLEHREKRLGTFTGRYDIVRLVYYECGSDARAAIAREKQVKGWSRQKKLALVKRLNPEFRDLARSVVHRKAHALVAASPLGWEVMQGIPRARSAARLGGNARDSSGPLRGPSE
jgi:putative endonuclease